MFSNNGKISNHQAVRLLVMDVFTGACLFLTMALPRICGNGGVAALILGFALTLAEGAVISGCLIRSGRHYIPSLGSGWAGYGLRWLYGARCFAVFVFLMGVFVSVLNETFLYTMSRRMIVGGMALILIYGCLKGIEVRARLSEIFFYLILIPIVLIGLFSLPEADWSRLLVSTDVTWFGVLQGTLVTWVLMTPVEWMLYIAPESPSVRPFKIFAWSIGIGGSLILLIYVLCVTVLSVPGMAAERWPTVILMQIVRIPGGFLSRQDGLMLSFWIFAMFISLSGALSHASDLWGTGIMKARKWKVILLAIIGSGTALYLGMDQRFMDVYFKGMMLTGIILLGVIPFVIGRRCQKKAAACLIALGVSTVLLGCENYVELENRAFVMALGVDGGETENFRFTYTFPDLGALTGQDTGEKEEPLTLEAGTLKEGEVLYDHISDKTLDYGQVKVLILGEKLAADSQKLALLLEEIRNKPEFVRTVFVCRCRERAEEFLETDTDIQGSVGVYLEEMMGHNDCEFILNDLMLSPEDADLPEVYLCGGKPALAEQGRKSVP